jgi:cytochrome bd-type quinol oxidase subunit 2
MEPLLVTLALSCFFTAIISLVLFPDKTDSLEGHEALTLAVMAGIFWAFLLTVCSVTVFFNLDPGIANNRVCNFLAYYFLPLAATVTYAIFNLTGGQLPDYMAMTAPFFVVHTCFYIQFNKRLGVAK